ncbi:MAG: hypothetical protein RIS94_188 [Pseudomonadota bacterium]|jgi:nucleoside-diphosphate-sugar epimerase
MRVAVFGANGYLGRHVAAHLAGSGHDVTGIVRSETAAADVRAMGLAAAVDDLSDNARVAALMADQDGAIFCAQLMLEDEARLFRVLISAFAGTDKALIMTSGTSLMSIPTGGHWDERNYAEDEPFTPRPQIAPRLDNEALVRDAQGVRGIVVRPPIIWGNGGCMIIGEFYHSARATGKVCHVGPGLNVYSHVHVQDLAELYRLALEKGKAGALYFAVTGEVAYGTLARMVAHHLGVERRAVSVEEACEIWDPFMGRIVLQSCSRQRSPRAREELGWSPREDRLDILDECAHPAYAAAPPRKDPPWLRRKN